MRDEKALYKTTNKVNKFGNKSAGNLGERNFVDISEQVLVEGVTLKLAASL